MYSKYMFVSSIKTSVTIMATNGVSLFGNLILVHNNLIINSFVYIIMLFGAYFFIVLSVTVRRPSFLIHSRYFQKHWTCIIFRHQINDHFIITSNRQTKMGFTKASPLLSRSHFTPVFIQIFGSMMHP